MANDYWDSSAAEKMKDFFSDTVDSRSLMHKALDDSERDVSPGFSKLLIAGKTPDNKFRESTRNAAAVSPGYNSYRAGDGAYGNVAHLHEGLDNEDQAIVMKRLKSELRFAKQQLELNEISHVTAKQAAERIFHGKKCSLEVFRSIEDKRTLLDSAISLHDGNSIIRILHFLEDTLTTQMFNIELLSRPIAIEHYISDLLSVKDYRKLFDIYTLLNKTEDAAYLKLSTSLNDMHNSGNPKYLENCFKTYFMNDANLNFEASLIKENLALFQYQKSIEDIDQIEEKKPAFQKQFEGVVRPKDLIGSPLISTIKYCATFHYNSRKGDIINPGTIKDLGNVSEGQYMWSLVTSQSFLKNWNQVDILIKPKRLIGLLLSGQHQVKMTSFLSVLDDQGAPIHVMNKYCDMISDLDIRVQLGSQFFCHESVINALAKLRDRESLFRYQNTSKLGQHDLNLIQHILADNRIKWKT